MIVIPMAGQSSRFTTAGYKKPKFMLEAHGMSMFEHSLKSFECFYENTPFLFITKNSKEVVDFVNEKALHLGILEFYVVELEFQTRGQAETVSLGIEKWLNIYKSSDYSDEFPITIFNIDTERPGYRHPELINSSYLEVFKGTGDNWSFVKPRSPESNDVILTAEKKPISDLCSTGLYYFSKYFLFKTAFENYLKLPEECWEKGELYVAPLYNYLIKAGYEVKFNLIERQNVIFFGTPKEYEDYKCNENKG
ncbi:glycosyltransferase family protein [Pseudoalteromonas gelatinilytica]